MKRLITLKIICFLILIVPITLFSQSKGYLGRRLVVHSDLFLARNHENPLFSWSVFVPRVQVATGLEYAVGKKIALGASLNLFNYGFDPTSTIEYMYQDTLPRKLFMNGIGVHLYFKTYLFKRSQAPYGLFLKFGVDWNTIKIDAHSFGLIKERIYGTHFEIGYDLRIGNRFRLSWGTFFKTSNELFHIFNTKRPTILQTAQRKNFTDFLIGTKLSFGFLAL